MNYSHNSTYRIGLIQAQAYRSLQTNFRMALSSYDITIPEWSLLGIMYDNERLNLTQISEILKSKASHPTVLVDRLVQLEYLERVVANADKRSREVSITVKGKAVVPKIEAVVRASLSASLNHIKRSDLEVYYKVLQQLAGQEDR